jgi:uncharacterized membrane protein YraQ (UPF0718 family)
MSKKLDITFWILIFLILVAIVYSLWQGGWQLTLSGLIQAGKLIEDVWLRLILGFIFAGLIQVMVPRELIAKWIGPTSGIKGILIGSYASIFTAGNPYIWLPIIASLYKAGAGAGPIIALITARGILSLQLLLIWQIPFFGIELAMARYIVCLFIPPLVGLAGERLLRIIDRLFQTTPKDPLVNGESASQQDSSNSPSTKEKHSNK